MFADSEGAEIRWERQQWSELAWEWVTVELITSCFTNDPYVCAWQISLSVTEELHIICFDTVFQYKDLTVQLQVQFSRTVFVSWKSSLPPLILAPRSSSGLLPPGHHHLQLQPAAERLGIHPLVQHDQPGHQGPTLRWTTRSPRCLLHLGWKRLFSQDVMFFANCPAATWPQFGEMLSWQFLAAAKRELAEEQLQMIARKLFGTTAILSSFVRSMTASIHVCKYMTVLG